MIDQFAFLISEGFKSFYRNKLASFLCVITIFINFSILGSLFVVGYNTGSLVDFLRSKYSFEVFLEEDVDNVILSYILETRDMEFIVKRIGDNRLNNMINSVFEEGTMARNRYHGILVDYQEQALAANTNE